MQYMTAYAIIEVANVGIGDGVLIRAASSSVGLAAIQLANWAGSISIACTRTSDKADALREQGAAHVIATEEEDLVARTHGESPAARARDRVRPGRRALRRHAGPGARAARHPVRLRRAQRAADALPALAVRDEGLSMRGWVASEIWNHPHRFKAAQEKILAGLAGGHSSR
jgi:threonine dehydrogenase-like Zn-dependent dehydrogenase